MAIHGSCQVSLKVEVIPPRNGISPGGVSITMKSLTLKLIKNIEAIKRGGGASPSHIALVFLTKGLRRAED